MFCDDLRLPITRRSAVRRMRLALMLIAPLLGAVATPVRAADDGAFPMWRSLRDPVVNMRTGPGEDYGIRFVYRRQHLPVKVLRTWGGWYFVEDPDGTRGWMMMRFVSREQTALINGRRPVEMHAGPGETTPLLWKLAPGVIGKLGDCKERWCRLDVDHHAGYVPAERLWGVTLK